MSKEIERKFLVKDISILQNASFSYRIHQYYINKNTRIRINIHSDGSQEAYITIKLGGEKIEREEIEFNIDARDAEDYLIGLHFNNKKNNLIRKTRFIIYNDTPFDPKKWEIDVFRDKNKGLILAEIELPSADCVVPMMEGIGEDVTGISRYYNSNLVKKPYSEWD